ncbi:MAG: hypothetical protein FK734_03765 [Asgard group archaeon]|nr:hypothetical protein [Asgard group archaeon]
MKQSRLFFSIMIILGLFLPIGLSCTKGESLIGEKPIISYQPMAVADSYEDDDTFETAKTINLNTIQDRSIYPIADPDFLVFELDTFYEVKIKIENSTGDTRMWLYDFDRNQLAFADNNEPSDLNSTISFWMLRPSFYFIRVEESGNDAEIDSYSIIISATQIRDEYESDDSPAYCIELVANSTYIRSINPADDIEYFTYTITSTCDVILETSGDPSGDTVMGVCTVADQYELTKIDENDDGGEGAYSKIVLTDQAPGTYYVLIWSYNYMIWIGNYSLHFTTHYDSLTDTQAPTISNVQAYVTELGRTDMIISSTISDANGISEAKIHYRVNNGGWNEINNINVAHQKYYNASLGPFAEGDTITYYFTARDNSSNHNLVTYDNGGEYFSYLILNNDYEGPLVENIEHIPASPEDDQTVIINCTATDVNDILSVTLYYRNNSGDWYNKPMTLDTGDNYIATIGQFEFDAYVEYYLIAIDNSTQENEATYNNGGANYYFTVLSGDHEEPSISDLVYNPNPPSNAEVVTVNCTITDAYTLASVDIYYRINSGTWIDTGLALKTGNVYEVIIGSFDYNDFVEFYINATDSSPNGNIAIEDNSGSYYSFTVTHSDLTPPVISSIERSIAIPSDTQAVNITCIAADGNGISLVRLYYRVEGGSWIYLTMNFLEDHAYFVTIGPFTEGYYVEYYIQATDDSPNHNEAINNNEGNFYSFTVINPTTSETAPGYGLVLTVIAITISIIIKHKKK